MYLVTFKQKHLLLLIFFIGFTSLLYEIYSTRILFFFISQTEWAITIGITSFLAGIALSSLLFSSLVIKNESTIYARLWLMNVLISLYGYFLLSRYEFIPKLIEGAISYSSHPSTITLTTLVVMWLFLFVPAFFIGGSFPLINGLFIKQSTNKTKGTALVYFWDTVGSILGAFITGFILIPFLGFYWTIITGAIVNLIISFCIAPFKKYRLVSLMVLLIFLSHYLISHDGDRVKSELESRFGEIIYQKESPYGLVTIGNHSFNKKGNKALFINYRDMCQSLNNSSEHSIGSLTVKQLPANSKVLSIGLGCGFTANSIARNANVETFDIVEINPQVVEGTKQFFKKENEGVLELPKTNLLIQDGAHYVRTTDKKYNAVVIDIEEPTIITSSPLYTGEYYNYIKGILTSDGILTLWAGKGSYSYGKLMYNTLKSRFSHVYMRLLDGYFTYYALNRLSPHFLPTSEAEKHEIDAVLSTPVNEINTLDNRAVEKYFSLKEAFQFPSQYKGE